MKLLVLNIENLLQPVIVDSATGATVEDLVQQLAAAQSNAQAAAGQAMNDASAANEKARELQNALDAANALPAELKSQVEALNTRIAMGDTQREADCAAAVATKDARIAELEGAIEKLRADIPAK